MSRTVRSPEAISLIERAGQAINASRIDEAEALAAQALKLDPQDSEAMHIMANVVLRRNHHAEAEALVRQSIALNANNPVFYLTLGLILQEQGKLDEAIAANEKALSFNAPALSHYLHTNQGICYYHKREGEKALEEYNKALSIKPDFAPALFRRGVVYYDVEGPRSEKMKADFDRAAELEPDNAAMFQKMTIIYHEARDYFQAIKILRHAINIRPDLEDAWVHLANSYFKIGNTKTALSIYEHLKEKYPDNPSIAIESACMFPSIAMSNEDITQWRERFMHGLDALIKSKFIVTSPERKMMNFPFSQGYHGRNNLELMQKMAEFFLACAPSLTFTAPHCLRPLKKKARIRIGFISELFFSELLTQFYGPLLDALTADERFEVVLMANSGRQNDEVKQLAAASRYITLPTYLPLVQKAVAAEEVDMLIYLDIGMNVMNYMLAFARLAPIQIVMSGHPITSGVPTLDYFVSSRAVEPENGQDHYCEKLLLPEKNTVVFSRKKMPENRMTRQELGLPEDKRLYCCPVQIFKLHPDMDKIFAAILARDPEALIILFDTAYKSLLRATLQERFVLSMPLEDVARIHFLPYAPAAHFYHVMRCMDSVLDTLHFSFGTTAFLMLGDNIPFVTLPGEFQRGRCGMVLYKEMEMEDLIADSRENYIELALKLAQDKDFHASMVEKVRANADRIFNDTSVIAPFKEMLWDVYQASSSA